MIGASEMGIFFLFEEIDMRKYPILAAQPSLSTRKFSYF